MRSTFAKTTILGAATILLLQGASATWYTAGTFEPDNAEDSTLFMRADPPGGATNLIYFNVVSGVSAAGAGVPVNHNVGLLETRLRPANLEYHVATLGVWADCNGDGYIGSALGAAREYPASLLSAATVCPPATGGPSVWTSGAHNYNGWVSELIPIGDSAASDRRVYLDADAKVWGDYNRPADPATGGGSCAAAPQPRGTYQSTGGFVTWVDCSTSAMEAWNSVWQGQRLLAQDVPGLEAFGLDLGLTFDDPDNASGSWIDHPTFGTEDESHSPAYVYDCEAAPLRSGDVLNETAVGPSLPNAAHNVKAYQVDVRPGDTDEPTIPALVNHTREGTLEDCDTSNDAGHDFYGAKAGYLGEDDFNSVSAANKREADWNFDYAGSPRGHTGASLVTPMGGAAGYNFGPSYSDWFPGTFATTSPAIVRVDLGEGTVELPPADHFTFYAHVGTATVGRGLLTPGGSEVYGKPQCGAHGSGIHNGWNCDPGTWYLNPDGTPIPEPARGFARPGQAYELRDVDCYDGSSRKLGLGVSPQSYGTEPCA